MPSIASASLGALLAWLSFAALPALARDTTAGDLTIEHPWARATPVGAEVAGGYVTVVNKGSTADRLVGASIATAAKAELHSMTMDGGVMKMRPTGPLDVPAGGTLTLDPSGTHIMFTGLRAGLRKGEAVEGTLIFEHAGTVPVRFDVEGVGAKSPSRDAGHAGHAMSGMDMD